MKKNLNKIYQTVVFILCLLTLNSNVFAGGGSVIGNGAGIVENNFQVAYAYIATAIEECLDLKKCDISMPEYMFLKKMKQVTIDNTGNKYRIIFMSDKTFPGFFDTGESQIHRIAKTGISSEDPIYVNTDMLYDEQSNPTLDFSTIVSILTHEIGHQAGEANHARLDILGAKFKKMSTQKVRSHRLEFGQNNDFFEATIINQNYPVKASELIIAVNSVGSKSVTIDLMEKIKCHDTQSEVVGFEIVNGHFKSLQTEEDDKSTIAFSFWIKVDCFATGNNQTTQEILSVDMNILSDLNFEFSQILKLK